MGGFVKEVVIVGLSAATSKNSGSRAAVAGPPVPDTAIEAIVTVTTAWSRTLAGSGWLGWGTPGLNK